jgi:hypothetical protein
MFQKPSNTRPPGGARVAIIAALTLALAVPFATQAFADNDHRNNGHHEEWHGHGNPHRRPAPYYHGYYQQPPVYYAPPPVYYGQPQGMSLNFMFPLGR